ncbi:hypothetical protein GWO43_29035 [candidate division KSB1 bacterium]|nr:hypothetical protein [candidate division KSB1 bacterium]NIR71570.1 hypothetical protein [candidate division KSB1 bacterium]NIS27952.1 hypothetical protein [candidate division KSB1 bacterium]NIT74833.1 hypothetical protein [candidate division KSB1 bacterium]NIU28609.1 hypothetical protein [candidate division KSB1 bacterium]
MDAVSIFRCYFVLVAVGFVVIPEGFPSSGLDIGSEVKDFWPPFLDKRTPPRYSLALTIDCKLPPQDRWQ